MTYDNAHELAARQKKITRVIGYLTTLGGQPTSKQAKAWTDAQWEHVARQAGVTSCSAATRMAVVDELRIIEKRAA